MNKKRISLLAAGLFLIGGFFVVKGALAAVGVTEASGGSAISADTIGAGWTSLGPIVIAEGVANDIPKNQTNKTLILRLPNAFEFNTAQTPNSHYVPGKDISSLSVVMASQTITITLTTPNGSGGENALDTITIGDTTPIQVRPTGTTPTTVNIYRYSTPGGGSAQINGIIRTSNADGSGGTNFGTLTEVAGAVVSITVSPNPVTVAYGGTQAFTAQGYDQFGNAISGLTYDWTTEAGTGTGSIDDAGLFTAGNSGTVTVKASNGGKEGTASVTVDVNPDIAIAQAVIDQINALPAIDDLTLEDKSAVESARGAYDALTPAQQGLVTNLATLTTAEAKIAELEAVSHIAIVTSAVYSVSAGGTASETITSVPFNTAKIDFLAALTPGENHQVWTAAGISDPVASGDTLFVTAQDGVTIVSYAITVDDNPDIAIAQSVIDMIDALQPVENLTLDDEQAVQSARTAYDDLTEVQRVLVTNIATLEAAEARIAELNVPPEPEVKTISYFGFPDLAVGSINQDDKTISVTVPFGTDVTALAPSIEFTGETIVPASGETQSFTKPVIYTIDPCPLRMATAVPPEEPVCESVSYTVTVSVEEENIISITSFGFASPYAEGVINEEEHTIAVKVPKNTDMTALVANFETTENIGSVMVGEAYQTSGETPNDFTGPVVYDLHARCIMASMVGFECDSASYAVTVTFNAAGRRQPEAILPVEVSNIPMSISGDQEGVAFYDLENGIKVKLSVMSGTVDNASTNGGVTFNVRYGTMEDAISNIYVDVTATDGLGNLIHTLLKKITISISGLALPPDLGPLYVAYFDEAGNSWTEISGTTFDAATGTATFQVDHLSRFAAFDRSRYAVPTPPAGSVTPPPEEEGEVLGKVVYADGTLLRAPNMRIYVIVNGKLRYIPTLKALAKYAGQEIINVGWDVINSFEMETGVVLGDTHYKDGTLLRGPDMRIYVIVNGKLKYIPTLAELFAKYRGKEIINVSEAVLNLYR